MKKILRKSTALLLTLSMIFTMFPLSALAAEEPAAVAGGVNGYAATMQADAPTKEDVNSAFVVESDAATDATEIGGSLRSASRWARRMPGRARRRTRWLLTSCLSSMYQEAWPMIYQMIAV